jgi:putative oxidoreductase
LPTWLAYATFAAEAVGGLLSIFGIQTRWVALALSSILLGATWRMPETAGFLPRPIGGWEYPLYLFVLCIEQSMLGDGA